jgi:hypothetical protein
MSARDDAMLPIPLCAKIISPEGLARRSFDDVDE